VHSEKFPVSRRVINGDTFSPICFVVALRAIMRKHGGQGMMTAFGVLIDKLEYADDAALINADCVKSTERITTSCAGALADADMEISAPKSGVMFCRRRLKTDPSTEVS
jgi:hypothetical protein